ncbi:MAG: flavin reductase family protein [Thermodesulfobacteriota bacterium]|jgi:flavin reductase (DIM6/NTAB) family NADH-FMN oxidoreductase RutF
MKKSLGAKIIVCATHVWVIGTYDNEGKPNMMTAAWGGVCCSEPPCVAVSLRKATYTYGNIEKRKAFTVNVPSTNYVKQTDYVGIYTGRNTNKFSLTNLTPSRSDFVDAPYVQEFPLVLECKLLHTLEIGLHTQFIGEILDVKAEESKLGEKGLPEVGKVSPFFYSPETRAYYKMGEYLGKAHSIGRVDE